MTGITHYFPVEGAPVSLPAAPWHSDNLATEFLGRIPRRVYVTAVRRAGGWVTTEQVVAMLNFDVSTGRASGALANAATKGDVFCHYENGHLAYWHYRDDGMSKPAPPRKASSNGARIRGFLEANPGWHTYADIGDAIGVAMESVRRAITYPEVASIIEKRRCWGQVQRNEIRLSKGRR